MNHYERATPNDPQFGSQWHHIDASDNDIDSDLAWDITTGVPQPMATALWWPSSKRSNYNHVDLIDNHWVNSAEVPGNGIDDDGKASSTTTAGTRPAATPSAPEDTVRLSVA